MDCSGSSVFQKKHRLGGLRFWAPRSSAFLLAGPWVKHFETSQWTLIQLRPVRNNQPQECGTGLFSSFPVILKSLQMYVLQEGHACFLTDVLNLLLLLIRGIPSKAIICSNAQFQQVQQGLATIPLGHSEIQQDIPYQGQFDVFILGCHTELPRIPSSFWPSSDCDTGGLPESRLYRMAADGLWCGDFLVLVLRRNTFGVSWSIWRHALWRTWWDWRIVLLPYKISSVKSIEMPIWSIMIPY